MKHMYNTFQNITKSTVRLALYSSLALAVLPSCSDFLNVETPPDVLINDKVFTSDKTATAAMLSIYIDMMNDQFGSNGSFVCGVMSSIGGMSANELHFTQNSTVTPQYQQFEDHALTHDNTYVRAFWKDGYKYIYRTNAIIDGLATATGMTDATKKQIEGEAKFMRAFCYFYLVNLFGDVPLVVNSDYHENMLMPRTPSTKVWEQIISDLKDAKLLLTDAYVTTERLRPNKWTASALLSRAYLYTQKWQEAELEANAIISSGTYATTLPALDKVFKKDSPETIWQLQPVRANSNTVEASLFAGSAYALTQQLLSSFESNDQRKTSWIAGGTGTPPSALPSKYKANVGALTEYYVVFRLTEQYLIRAEARAQLSKISEGLSDVNVVRQRAGLLATTAASKEILLQAIEKERQVEFFAEWGHRWFDLKRTNRAEAVLKPLSGINTWKQGADLFPIPELEIRANPKLSQNDAYL
ncbi:RagB/SusD family nutrient uptake outer membrane protein [Solitalea lacus]|uniref:RagB/SusD family nutrient uptake outer membrane protein n=1 Tax=Solitalea lacus TaxID=2911172 RepID=UPI001EDBA957|nr:RagB/SusD family nutrient uptake outer membrane protein [Solitalea lacus]UKJ06933.1 RagB/SusD family nutrient uptake outer membrane protein [Solitalea lacus]